MQEHTAITFIRKKNHRYEVLCFLRFRFNFAFQNDLFSFFMRE